MDVTADLAASLGFPKLKYTAVERERRWLARDVPNEGVTGVSLITDLYITGSRLRLREERPTNGGPVLRRLGRKADVDSSTRLITSIYMPENEYDLLAVLPGRTVRKRRHQLGPGGIGTLMVDVFEDALTSLITAEIEFDTDAKMAAYVPPDFCYAEVTDDPRYGGGWLAANGLPHPT